MFRVELADWVSGARMGQASWRGLVLDRALNGGTNVTFQIANDDQAASFAAMPHQTVRVWEDEELRFHGRVREPMIAKPGLLEVTAGSPYTLLDRRVMSGEFVAYDQAEILRTIINVQNNRGDLSLGRTGFHYEASPYPTSVTRDRLYDPGKSVQEIFAELAAVIDGPYFVEEPMLDPAYPQDLVHLVIRWPDSGTDLPGVRFEYGKGTLANLTGYTLTTLFPLNEVTVTGAAGVADGEAQDKDSQDVWGAFDGWFSEPDVSDPVLLDEKAAARLRSDPVVRVEIEAGPTGPAVNDPHGPRLFHDFDVGDTVYVSIRDETTEIYDSAQTVTQARVTVSEEDDSERLELTLQPPGQPIEEALE